MNVDEYHKLAEVEDRMWYFRALHRHVELRLVEALGEGTSEILDAGCGTGGLIARLGARHPAWRWSGVDLSEVACGLAQRRFGRVATATATSELPAPELDSTGPKICRGDVTRLPFPDASFDAIVSADVLYHVDDDAAALREFQRVLRPGGVVVVNVPAYRWLWSYHDDAVHSRRRYDRQEVIGKFEAAGLGKIKATYWNTLPFPLVVVRRKLLPAPRGGSDVHLFPGPIENGFDVAMAAERTWLRAFGRLPFGTSVLATGMKPAEP
ncbi:MAG TPA: class I SAM-dependent methyltransferase [Opitutaceae bacterium]|nr:class I SAM-dependent methyltransferase [Opitutaceae bacterium]